MEYGRVIKRALEIVWHHKVLWIFGVVAVFFGAGKGSGGGSAGPSGTPLQYTFNQGDLERWRRGMPFGMRPPFFFD